MSKLINVKYEVIGTVDLSGSGVLSRTKDEWDQIAWESGYTSPF